VIIHPYTVKKKKRKPNAKQRELQASWQEILKKYETKTIAPNKKVVARPSNPSVVIPVSRITNTIPSLDSGQGNAVKMPAKVYTGDAMIGISTLHKSNAVPVFRQEDAVDIAKMRRG
jgi:hypothetical protein